ncbi:hypothetical protein FKG94_13485 [Exilibacterium tricleocarpae]|uniref:Uncharacterized protein n=1 Tax=Exilibacterium tricleocarpae TaxID=2591008 RepID=A0A545TLL5_9GAMM|nr:hypothetical protein [Exilibacterium tricleocarpae]TQV78088.1 hypothetical protein FKG94_13485 [Exilibacterium tricleocarpae]
MSSEKRDRRQPLDDKALSSLYRRAPRQPSPAALDRKILAAAGARRPARPHNNIYRRWLPAISVATVAGLALLIVFPLQPPPPLTLKEPAPYRLIPGETEADPEMAELQEDAMTDDDAIGAKTLAVPESEPATLPAPQRVRRAVEVEREIQQSIASPIDNRGEGPADSLEEALTGGLAKESPAHPIKVQRKAAAELSSGLDSPPSQAPQPQDSESAFTPSRPGADTADTAGKSVAEPLTRRESVATEESILQAEPLMETLPQQPIASPFDSTHRSSSGLNTSVVREPEAWLRDITALLDKGREQAALREYRQFLVAHPNYVVDAALGHRLDNLRERPPKSPQPK